MENKFDAIIIGAGPAGYECALYLGDRGKSVCLVEKSEEKIGGTCLNEGCIPVKSLVESAHLIHRMREYKSIFNIDFSIDYSNAIKLLEDQKYQLRQGVISRLKKSGVKMIFGEGRLAGYDVIRIGNVDYFANNIVLSTGSYPKSLPGLTIDENKIISSSGLLKLGSLPKDFLIVGGGYVGCEFASLLNYFGSNVTIVEFLPKIMGLEDDEVSRTLLREFKKRNISVNTSSEIVNIQNKDEKLLVSFKNRQNNLVKDIFVDVILVSVGRVPNTKYLNLEVINAKTERDFIITEKDFSIDNSSVYAVGDIIKTPMLANVATREGIAVAKKILGETENINYELLPRVVFTDPGVGCIGFTEEDLKSKVIPYKTYKAFFKGNGKALIMGQNSGFFKALTSDEGTIIGAMFIGPMAYELVHIMAVAMKSKVNITELRDIIYGHPTISEIVFSAII
ncbi:MAG TPA: NAD(P)/FAD-dependent oxidoreductase [Thermodesulfobium narugense]|uniref:Dihydrolipoyl dehydrogenase n=1 Tax=Thermodesulfobium acidiphilum TaxID=1794699 RepID=A0A2R4W0Y5_THEAF|nr:NAD(P)/FAD-dependent oxidoreductase [Thermodesulfobium acidiphilum]AWB10467.1 dihydrolipoamide dehydrogenase [Thermodesulfobium acidiphilum]HEM55296.1 NAD(P)/FAD-dependent oxidoreductase [Thermodesulfobium narugense]